MDITNVYGTVLFTAAVSTLKELVLEAVRQKADLRDADLRDADLRDADLYGANLYGADLHGADLHGANLRSANLYGADLYGANLYGANLRDANLRSANLRDANLRDAKDIPALALAQLQFIPDEGSFIGWKKCGKGVIVKLRIPEDAKRSHGTGRKCRASHVEVLEVIGAEVGVSLYDGVTEYRKGETVTADSFGENRWDTCSNGIHFYITRLEAENHN